MATQFVQSHDPHFNARFTLPLGYDLVQITNKCVKKIIHLKLKEQQ